MRCDSCSNRCGGDICKIGLTMRERVSCVGYNLDLMPSILGKHAGTITFDKTNPFYVTTIIPSVKNVIFHPPATIILWGDGTKTVVKCREGETYDHEVGLAMCLCKKMLGTDYRRWFKNRLKKGGKE